MSFSDLNHDNVLLYAMKAYDQPNMILSEFSEDFKRFNYLKKLFGKYRRRGYVKEQLILNHLTVIYNVFGVEPATRLLFYNLSRDDFPALKTYLLFLNCMPEIVRGIDGKDILSSDIPVDMNIVRILRKFK